MSASARAPAQSLGLAYAHGDRFQIVAESKSFNGAEQTAASKSTIRVRAGVKRGLRGTSVLKGKLWLRAGDGPWGEPVALPPERKPQVWFDPRGFQQGCFVPDWMGLGTQFPYPPGPIAAGTRWRLETNVVLVGRESAERRLAAACPEPRRTSPVELHGAVERPGVEVPPISIECQVRDIAKGLASITCTTRLPRTGEKGAMHIKLDAEISLKDGYSGFRRQEVTWSKDPAAREVTTERVTRIPR